jgi:hypothetical protein
MATSLLLTPQAFGATPPVEPLFTLAVDDFGIKYFSKADADHLFDAFATRYPLTKDWTGSSYLGFHIDWNYEAGHVDIPMPIYVPKALLTLRHPPPTKPQHSPHPWTAPVYGQTVQLANTDLSPLLDKLGIKRVQQISGLFLYYSRGCDPTILVALNEIPTARPHRRYTPNKLATCFLTTSPRILMPPSAITPVT